MIRSPFATETIQDVLGEIVTWDMAAREVPLEVIVAALEDAGIDVNLPELRPTSAFTRAKKGLGENRIIKRLEENGDDKVVFQFTQEHLDRDSVDSADELRFNYSFEAKVQLDRTTGEVTCHERPDIVDLARDLIKHAMEHRNARDITTIVKKLFQRHADLFPVNPTKGVAYFVPKEHLDFVEKVENFLTSVGGVLHRFPVPKGTEKGDKSVKEAIRGGLDSMIGDLESSVEKWEEGKTRESTTVKALERWRLISGKVDAYATYLDVERERLQDALRRTKSLLAERIADVTVSD